MGNRCRMNDFLENIESKLITVEQWQKIRAQCLQKKVVFTNGCFDILHRGHVHYLAEARALGDCLIVGLNSDASVKRLKGETRPVNAEKDRAFLLAALSVVDYVVLFEEDTPLELIRQVVPDVLVKGGDYAINDIVGADVVMRNGGEVKVLQFVDGYSSTKVIDKMLK